MSSRNKTLLYSHRNTEALIAVLSVVSVEVWSSQWWCDTLVRVSVTLKVLSHCADVLIGCWRCQCVMTFGDTCEPGAGRLYLVSTQFVGRCGSLVESSCWHLEFYTISFTPHCAISLSSLNKHLAINTGGMSNLRAVIDAWLIEVEMCLATFGLSYL